MIFWYNYLMVKHIISVYIVAYAVKKHDSSNREQRNSEFKPAAALGNLPQSQTTVRKRQNEKARTGTQMIKSAQIFDV